MTKLKIVTAVFSLVLFLPSVLLAQDSSCTKHPEACNFSYNYWTQKPLKTVYQRCPTSKTQSSIFPLTVTYSGTAINNCSNKACNTQLAFECSDGHLIYGYSVCTLNLSIINQKASSAEPGSCGFVPKLPSSFTNNN